MTSPNNSTTALDPFIGGASDFGFMNSVMSEYLVLIILCITIFAVIYFIAREGLRKPLYGINRPVKRSMLDDDVDFPKTSITEGSQETYSNIIEVEPEEPTEDSKDTSTEKTGGILETEVDEYEKQLKECFEDWDRKIDQKMGKT